MHRYSNLVRWLAVVLWTAVILVASSDAFSADHSGGWLEAFIGRFAPPEVFAAVHFAVRKLAHLVVYGILAALAFRAARGDGWRLAVGGWQEKGRWAVTALVIVLVVACVDEWHQSTIPTRTGTPVDVAIDLAGALIALSAFARGAREKIRAP